VAVAQDGTWLASGGWDGMVRIWDVASWAEQVSMTCHPDGVWAVAVAPDGTWLASGGSDKTVRVWDVTAR
jgi:WD40 repeat protein